jgi:hypothetical protein
MLVGKTESRIVTAHMFTLLFWSGTAVIVYSWIAASIRYVHYLRRGHKIMAAQAMLKSMLSLAGLVALWFIHQHYAPG